MATTVETYLSAEEIEGKKIISSIAMTVLLVTFSMLFATLLLGYSAFRLTNDEWPPMGMDPVDLFYPTISTIIIALSSFSYYKLEKAFTNKEVGKAKMWHWVTLLLGMAFVATQFILWETLKSEGFYVDGGVFPSLIFGLTWVHAAHMALGLISLVYLFVIFKKEYWEQYTVNVNNVGKFWHFLGVVWALMFVTMFVL